MVATLKRQYWSVLGITTIWWWKKRKSWGRRRGLWTFVPFTPQQTQDDWKTKMDCDIYREETTGTYSHALAKDNETYIRTTLLPYRPSGPSIASSPVTPPKEPSAKPRV